MTAKPKYSRRFRPGAWRMPTRSPTRSPGLPATRPDTSLAPSSPWMAVWAWVTEETTVLLEGKNVLVTGVLTEQSIAFNVAKIAQEQGARLVLTGFGRMSLVERIARRLPQEAPVIELDVTNKEHLDGLADKV